MSRIYWKHTIKKNGSIYRNGQVSILLSGTDEAARVFTAETGGDLLDTAPQLATDSDGFVEFWIDEDDHCDGQLFAVNTEPDSLCDQSSVHTFPALQLLPDKEGGRHFRNVFSQNIAPSKADGAKNGDIWFDRNHDNDLYTFDYDANLWIDQISGGTVAPGWSTVINDDGHKPENDADVTGNHQADVVIDNITDGATHKKVTAGEQSKLNTAVHPDGFLQSWAKAGSNVIPGSGGGMYYGADYMGYHNGTSWQIYIEPGKYYFGGDANNYHSWDGTKQTISTSGVNAIIIKAGGDILLEGDVSNPGLLNINNSIKMGYVTGMSAHCGIWPVVAGADVFCLGGIGPGFSALWLRASGHVTMGSSADYVTVDCTKVGLYHGSNIRLVANSVTAINVISSGITVIDLIAASHKATQIGASGVAFGQCYADDWNNVADFYYMDDRDDLALISAIKGSGKYDKHTGFELINDDTIPKELLSVHRSDCDDGKAGDVAYDPDGKPYLSNKTMISVLMGCIRQLDAKVEALA